MLGDGTYDVIVVDAELLRDGERRDDGSTGSHPAMRLDLTILTGPHKGEVVSMRALGLGIDEVDALGLPGTMTVEEGEPTVALDR